MIIELAKNIIGEETFYLSNCDDLQKKAGWFYFSNKNIDNLDNRMNFLWHRYQESFNKRNPFVDIQAAQEVIKHELIYDFQKIFNSSLEEIALFAKSIYGSGAYEILEENPLFNHNDLNTIKSCLQKRA